MNGNYHAFVRNVTHVRIYQYVSKCAHFWTISTNYVVLCSSVIANIREKMQMIMKSDYEVSPC